MPPKTKFKREDIIEIAFNFVRQNGWETLSARYIAKELGSSTRPIYSYFSSMLEIKDAVMKKTLELYFTSQTTTRTEDEFLDMGMGVISFAKNEPHLFRFMYDARNMPLKKKYDEFFFINVLEKLSQYPRFNGFSPEMKKEFVFNMYTFALGMTVLIESSWAEDWTEEDIKSILRETGQVHYDGFLEKIKKMGQ